MNFEKDKVKDVMLNKMCVSISHFYHVLFSSQVIKSGSFPSPTATSDPILANASGTRHLKTNKLSVGLRAASHSFIC